MKSIIRIIKEEFLHMLKEMDDVDYGMYEKQDELKYKMLYNFLFDNTPEFDKQIYWRVVPAARLKKIWEDYIKLGFVRDTKGLEMIEGIMISAALKLESLTYLSGHSPQDPKEDFEDMWGDYVDDYLSRVLKSEFVDPNQTEIPYDDPTQPFKRKENVQNFIPNENYSEIRNIPFQEYFQKHEANVAQRKQIREDLMEILMDKFYEFYSTDSEGNDIMSDYGTKPLVTLAFALARENDDSQKVVIIDKMLNVVHQRSDLASWFIEGGSAALSDISGYEVPTEDGWGGQSTISGKYNLFDY